MRTQRATRYNAPSEHNSFGIYNWFTLRGVYDHEIINEVVYSFCLQYGFKGLSPKTPDKTKLNFVGNRFNDFRRFAMEYLKTNNYLPIN